MIRIALVVLSYNGLEDTRKCLASLSAQAQENPEILSILVDNGSTDGTADFVRKEFTWCNVHRVDVNRGPSAGNNRGIEFALSKVVDWIILLNNDTTASPDFLRRMADLAASPQGFDILGPVIRFMDEPAEVMTDGVRFNPEKFMGFFQRVEVPVYDDVWPPKVTEVDVVNGCCMMIASSVVEKIGLFDESFFIYHDETDYCLRAKLAGFRAGVFSRALIFHKGGRSFESTGKKGQRYYDARNLAYLVKRYAGKLPGARTRMASVLMYLRHMYHRYCMEREAGQYEAAAAVIEGMLDAMRKRVGQYASGARAGSKAVMFVFETARVVLPRLRQG